MEFLVWHAVAMTTVVAVSFVAGYYTAAMSAKRKNK
tara:strand:+ start:6094 stop:6201 length:108 start_codon:yes stop_codon:yes gene_type:complete